ncbi:MAG TPA: SPOR domain-containing protein, partial [Blastocatellia bacterium]|nr:SPOR domain-containing protein [Blastocatellia bacterium]
LKSEVPGKGIFYRVRVGSFADQTTAQQKGEQLQHAQLIKSYYVTLYEGSSYQPISAPIALSPNGSTHSKLATNLLAITEEEEDEAEDAEVEPALDQPPPATQKKGAQRRAKRPIVRRIINQTGVVTGVGNVPIQVPFEQDDIGEGCFFMSTGSSVTSINSFGVFTKRDQVMGAVIPYAGTEANLKFKAGDEQGWTPPRGVISADVIRMRVNPAGYREFHAVEPPINSFQNIGGKIMFRALPQGEYMIRGRLGNGKCVFLPLSVREDCCTVNSR